MVPPFPAKIPFSCSDSSYLRHQHETGKVTEAEHRRTHAISCRIKLRFGHTTGRLECRREKAEIRLMRCTRMSTASIMVALRLMPAAQWKQMASLRARRGAQKLHTRSKWGVACSKQI